MINRITFIVLSVKVTDMVMERVHGVTGRNEAKEGLKNVMIQPT
jgi:hypothetical protein